MDAGHAPMINEGVWVALSFVVFVALVWKRAGSAMATMFDKRADEIRSTLEEARTLRDEAQNELKKYQKLNREAAAEAEQITANALAAAESIRDNAAKAAEASIKRKEDQAAAKIKAMEAEVVAELRERAAELATAAAASLITTKLDDKSGQDLIRKDIEQIKKIG
ncbi:MAG: ATP synthase F0 subunit B [Candidatus Puniceispirillales bacterium]